MPAHTTRDPDRIGRICYIIEAALEYFVSIMTTGAYLARITNSLGLSDSLTGILASFVSLGCVFRLGSITLFRGARRVKRPIVLCNIVVQILFGCVYLTPVLPLGGTQKTLLFLVCFCGAIILSNLITPPKANWLMSLVADGARGTFTARKEIVSLLGGMTFTYLCGSAIDLLEAAGNMRMTFVLGSVAIFVLTVLHTLSLVPIHEKPLSTGAAGGKSLRALFANKRFLCVVPVIMIWNIAHYCATPFYGPYQIKELGFSMTFVSVLSIAYSLVRVAVSPAMGRLADKTSFSRMVAVCFLVAAAGFLVNCFTVPQNGHVCYTVYYCLFAVSMAGINSAMTNLVYDCVKGEGRSNALAISSALGGLCGFGATCLMSPWVAAIQQNGNRLWGLSLYPAQVVSAVAFVITALLVVYVRAVVIPVEKRAAAKED